ncbi:MAG TPA: PIN domain-containing protein [Thermoleophilaceae bacterium]
MAVALDADAIVGFLDRSDALHASAVELVGRAVAGDTLVISAITLAEVLTGVRLGHHDEALVQGFFADLVTVVVSVDEQVAEAAARIRAETGLRMPDSLVLATALVQPDVRTLITGDAKLAKAAENELEVLHLVEA